MFKVIECLLDGREIIHGYADSKAEAELKLSSVLASGRYESFSLVSIMEVRK